MDDHLGLSRRVLPDWMADLPMQQQSVLLLALRGPDGDPKRTPFKDLLRAYRGTVLNAARYGRLLAFGEKADSFMSLDLFADFAQWKVAVELFVEDMADGSNLHHYTHFMHGAEILAYKHPDQRFRDRWILCYKLMVGRLHLTPESEVEMDERLSDWNREGW